MTADSVGTISLMVFGGIIIAILLKILFMVHTQTKEMQRMGQELHLQHTAEEIKEEK